MNRDDEKEEDKSVKEEGDVEGTGGGGAKESRK